MTPRADARRAERDGRPGLRPDPTRVIGELFVPGHALAGGRAGRATTVVSHVLDLTDGEVTAALAELMTRFGDRHRNVTEMFERHAERLANRVPPNVVLSVERRRLLGAAFTHEYALEAASVCNPSAVPAIDQTGLGAGEVRFLLSVRQIGEGHRSSVGFRQGVFGPDGTVTIDDRGPFATAGAVHHATPALDTRGDVADTVSRRAEAASHGYTVTFPDSSPIDERVLTPVGAAEANGIEDARFVRFTGGDGPATYYATYTAYDGATIRQHLLETTDFETFTASPLFGEATRNKGLALFPRPIGGDLYALSRHDGETNAIARSRDVGHWSDATPVPVPRSVTNCVQTGNCGSPIELDEGWLVFTHDVGPMRTYTIGALLLDLEDPTTLLGHTTQPLIAPNADGRDGYVPNVVYSCGAIRHEDQILLPLGISDSRIGFATLTVAGVLDAISGHRSPAHIAASTPADGDRAPHADDDVVP